MDLPIGQGHGVAGRFAGLPDQFALESNSAIALLPVPFDMTTTYQHGCDKGPTALIEASRHLELYDIETDFEVYKMGIFTDRPLEAPSSVKMLKKTYERTKKLIDEGKFVVVLGGEHSISPATVQAHAEAYGPLSVLQLDAHADLQVAYENNPYSHASVMSRVKEIPNISKLVAVGIRSLSVEEKEFIDFEHTFFAHQLDKEDTWIEKVVQALTDTVYITFDLDVFDCSIMPSTGTPEPGGLTWNQATKLLKRVFESKNVVGCDVVELCPNPNNLAPDFLAAKLVYKILSYKFKRASA
jgi:agmatinase